MRMTRPAAFYTALAVAFYLHGLPGWAVALAVYFAIETASEG